MPGVISVVFMTNSSNDATRILARNIPVRMKMWKNMQPFDSIAIVMTGGGCEAMPYSLFPAKMVHYSGSVCTRVVRARWRIRRHGSTARPGPDYGHHFKLKNPLQGSGCAAGK
jgi:hypothetical protein